MNCADFFSSPSPTFLLHGSLTAAVRGVRPVSSHLSTATVQGTKRPLSGDYSSVTSAVKYVQCIMSDKLTLQFRPSLVWYEAEFLVS